MIVFSGSVGTFIDKFEDGLLIDEIEALVYQKLNKRVSKSERISWTNSMSYMNNVLAKDVNLEAGVAVEFNIPNTSKRIDFMVLGENEKKEKQVIIIELKQWDFVEEVEHKDALVRTLIQGGLREVAHPSYQAWSYAKLLEDFNEEVYQNHIQILPCVYMHNYRRKSEDPIDSNKYEEYTKLAKVYDATQLKDLRKLIATHTQFGDDGKLVYRIEHGKIKPSKSLQDSLSKMLQGNQEFIMIDDQKVIYENIIYFAHRAKENNEKTTIIIEGGPGTGKTVVAINALVQLLNQDLNGCYISKNSAPRNVYATKLAGVFKKNRISALFQGSGAFTENKCNDYDFLLVDEAHRLNEKSGMFQNLGEHQVKEIIHSSLLSIFFVDENQQVTTKDVGNIKIIEDYAKQEHSRIVKYELSSQFRCNGSDGYLAWLDLALEIRETANYDLLDYDFKVIDSPTELFNIILEKNKINNKSRMLAGYCWKWNKDGKNDPQSFDIQIGDFQASWNLGNSTTWAIDESSVYQVGCIHTSQGLEFDYVGVIIGDDLRYENGRLVTDFKQRASTDTSIKGLKSMYKNDPIQANEIAERIIKNTYRTLMTRGMKGCYIYCTNPELQQYFKDFMYQNSK